MAVVTERWSGVNLQKQRSGWSDVRVFDVSEVSPDTEFQAHADVHSYVISNDGITLGIKLAAEHPNSSYLQVKSTSTKVTSPGYYQVTVNYGTAEGGGTVEGDNPFQSPPTWAWNPITQQVLIEEDVDGNPIVNSAKVPYDQPPTIDDTFYELTITRNEPYFNINQAMIYKNVLNSNAIRIQGRGGGTVAAGQMMLKNIKPSTPYTLNDNFVKVSYTFWLREDGFKLRRLDIGYNKWIDGEDDKEKITDVKGKAVQTPQLLNGEGAPLFGSTETGVGKPPGATREDTSSAVFLIWDIRPSRDFTTLRLFRNA